MLNINSLQVPHSIRLLCTRHHGRPVCLSLLSEACVLQCQCSFGNHPCQREGHGADVSVFMACSNTGPRRVSRTSLCPSRPLQRLSRRLSLARVGMRPLRNPSSALRASLMSWTPFSAPGTILIHESLCNQGLKVTAKASVGTQRPKQCFT